MPAPTTSAKIQRRLGDTLDEQLQAVADAARQARDHGAEMGGHQATLVELDASHEEVKDEGKTETFGRVMIGIGAVIAALFFDYVLLASVAHFLTQSLDAGVRQIATYLVPIAIVAGELGVAAQIYRAKIEAEENAVAPRPGDQAQVRKWKMIGWATLLAITMLALVTFHKQILNGGSLDWSAAFLLGGAAMFGVWAHFLVVFGGDKAHKARSYATYKYLRNKAERRLGASARKQTSARDGLDDALRGYALAYDRYESSCGVPPPALRIDTRLRALINEAAGEELIAAPDGTPVLPQPPAPRSPGASGDGQAAPIPEPVVSPAPAPAEASEPADEGSEVDDLAADNDLLRQALEAQIRNTNGEIRP